MKKIISLLLALAMCFMVISVTSYAAVMTYENGAVNISGLEGEAALIQASYNNGVLSGVTIHKALNGRNEVTANDGDRFYLWNSINGITPLGDPITVGASDTDTGEENVVVDPALGNEVKVPSNGPYESNFDQTYFVEDKVLNNGYTMPVLGIGTYALTVEQAENSVYHALKDGYRLVDTARAYNNEVGVGRGIKRAIDEGLVKREDIFVTTKVWDTDFGMARTAFDASLERLGLEYVDLVLLHHIPRANDEIAYHALEGAVKEGKIRSLGLSNIYLDNTNFDRMYKAAEIKPVLVQNENHPFFQNTDFQQYISQYGMFVESWYPLGGRGFTQNYFNHATLLQIAAAHNKTVAQILLRWHVQAGYITIPGSSNPDHIAENYDIFDFELTDEEMQTIKKMDTGDGNFNHPNRNR